MIYAAGLLCMLIPLAYSAPVHQETNQAEINVIRDELTGAYTILIEAPYFKKLEFIEKDGTITGNYKYVINGKTKSLEYLLSKDSYFIVGDTQPISEDNAEDDSIESDDADDADEADDDDDDNSVDLNKIPITELEKEVDDKENEEKYVYRSNNLDEPQVEVVRDKLTDNYIVTIKMPHFVKSEIVETNGNIFGDYKYKQNKEYKNIMYVVSNESFTIIGDTEPIFNEHHTDANEGDVNLLNFKYTSVDVVKNRIKIEEGKKYTYSTKRSIDLPDHKDDKGQSVKQILPEIKPTSTENILIVSMQNLDSIDIKLPE